MSAEPVCIRRVPTIEEAQIIVDWLDDNDVKATIVDRDNPGVFAFGVTDVEGIAIFVSDESAAARAKELLVEHDQEMASKRPTAPVAAVCEECGASTTYAPEQAGTVQECGECNAYLDVPEAA